LQLKTSPLGAGRGPNKLRVDILVVAPKLAAGMRDGQPRRALSKMGISDRPDRPADNGCGPE